MPEPRVVAPRIVVDTNVLVSRTLLPESIAARAVRRIVDQATLLVSDATLMEFAEVLTRRKFDAYISVEERQSFFRFVVQIAETVPITTTVRVCRDRKDDKFLELAISGAAALIVTGDRDLLALSSYRRCAIVTPAQFLAMPAATLNADPSGES